MPLLVRGAAFYLGGNEMERLQQAIVSRKEGNLEESRGILLELVEQYPDDASIQYHCAWTHDALGLEMEAVTYYETAIDLGLTNEDEETGAYIGLGSSFRTIGKYEKSKEILLKGLEKYPDNHGMKAFLSMTLYNLGEHAQAMEILLTALTSTTNDPYILKCKRAIDFYSDKLDQTWN